MLDEGVGPSVGDKCDDIIDAVDASLCLSNSITWLYAGDVDVDVK